MKNSIYFIIIIVAVLGISGCSEDYLDLKPTAEETEVSYYTTFKALDRTATAAYGILCTRDIFDFYYFMGYASIADDSEVGGENTNDWPEFQSMDRLLHHPDLDYVFDSWSYCYKGIRMTNEFLSRVDIINKSDPLVDKNLMMHRIAEMKFLRAFYHFYLLQVYGGVPIADRLLTPEDDLPRASIAEVLHFIEKDLTEAIPYLKEKSQNGSEVGRATKGSASALLAKAYLYESSYANNYTDDDRFNGCAIRWDSSLKYSDAVIQSREYHLVGYEGERFNSWRDPVNGVGGYRWIFTVDGDNSDEGVWEIQNVNDGLDWTYTRGTYLVVYTTIRFYTDANGNRAIANGWSFNLPTPCLLHAFGNQDRRETNLHSAETNPILDPRFSTTVGCTDTIVINGTAYSKPWDTVLIGLSNGSDRWFRMDFSNLPTNTISRKYEASPDEFWRGMVNFNDGPVNLRYIRYADVVLMAAEAAYMLNDHATALDYVNQVRTRARMSGDTGYPENLTDISFEDIVHERRLELAMEGARGFDLIRWRLAEKYIDGIQLEAWPTASGIDFVPGKHEFFPIPNSEIQLSSNLKQYPGWK
ncbi:MAG: RagB/SusD family nutrient uptake outer membrane protein [Bacteroidales bacterium]|nr:RagB/SusD family nutrient uptake outer membrane protein [Bacteroidales bacterium]